MARHDWKLKFDSTELGITVYECQRCHGQSLLEDLGENNAAGCKDKCEWCGEPSDQLVRTVAGYNICIPCAEDSALDLEPEDTPSLDKPDTYYSER